MTGFALFGAGRLGQIYLRNLLQYSDVNLRYVVANTRESLDNVRRNFILPDSCKLLSSADCHEELYNNKSVHACLIASATSVHEEQIKNSMSAKKHVFCEKPVSFHHSTTLEICSIAERDNLHLFCAFQRRFDRSFVQVKRAIDEGRLGRVHVIKVCSRDGKIPPVEYLTSSGGFIRDSAIHDLDMACWLAGETPTEIYTIARGNRKFIADIGDYDTLVITVKFPSGTVALIDLSRFASYGYDQRLEVLGENGSMISVGNDVEHNATTAKTEGITASRTVLDCVDRYMEAYDNELRHFVNVLQDKEKIRVTVDDIRNIDKIAAFAEESAKLGRPVKINLKD